jgi:hypothetical protein
MLSKEGSSQQSAKVGKTMTGWKMLSKEENN